MATTATCTRFTDEYQLYEELGKYGARCVPRAAPRHPPRPQDPPALPGALCRCPCSPGSRRRISRRAVIRLSNPASTPAASPLEGKVFLRPWVFPTAGWGVPATSPGLRAPVAPRDFLASPLALLRTRLPRSFPRTVSLLDVVVPFNCFCAGTRHCYCHSAMLQSPLPCPCETTRCCCTALLSPSLPLSALVSALADLLLHPRTGLCRGTLWDRKAA